MQRSGSATLRLHGGNAPAWLVVRMTRLSSAMFKAMANVYGAKEILVRLSDPFFFQSSSKRTRFEVAAMLTDEYAPTFKGMEAFNYLVKQARAYSLASE